MRWPGRTPRRWVTCRAPRCAVSAPSTCSSTVGTSPGPPARSPRSTPTSPSSCSHSLARRSATTCGHRGSAQRSPSQPMPRPPTDWWRSWVARPDGTRGRGGAPDRRRAQSPRRAAPAASMTADDAYRTQVRIDAEPGDVFPSRTAPDLLRRWMGEWADLEPRPGGRFEAHITGVPVRGEYLVVEPPHRVVFTWGTPGSDVVPAGSSTVEVTLRSDGGGTLLELEHRDLPPDELPRHGMGWDHYLPRLALAAGGADPGPDPWADAAG